MGKQRISFVLKTTAAACYLLLAAVVYRMFLRQAIRYPGRLGAYDTDLRVHIQEGRAGTGYSLMERCYALLLDTLGQNEKAIGIFLALVMTATVYLTYRLLRMLAGDCRREFLHLLAFVPVFAMPLYLGSVNPYRYLGLQSGAIWHNTTYIGMRAAAMALLLFYFPFQERYRKHVSATDFVIFTVLLVFVNMMKPNFIMCFAPAMACMLLADCITDRGRTLKQQILSGIPVLLSLCTLLYQMVYLFPEGERPEGGAAFGFSVAYILKLRTWHPVASLLQSAAFPLVVLIYNFRDLKKDRRSRMTWLIWVVGLLEYLFIHEEGARKDHGNLSWGYSFCIFLVFVVSIGWLCRNIQELWREYRSSEASSFWGWIRSAGRKWKLEAAYLLVSVVLLVWHLACGMEFFLYMLQGGTYIR